MTSKLSTHTMGDPTRIMDFLHQAKPTVVKIFDYDSPETIKLIRTAAPVVVYRQYFDRNYDQISPDEVVNALLSKLAGLGLVFEGINEPILNSIDDAKKLNTWYVRFGELMHAAGEQSAAYSFSTGNPNLSYAPYLADGLAACTYYAQHEYVGINNDFSQIGYGKKVLQQLPQSAWKPILVTETGADAGGCKDCGWQGSIYHLSPDQYMNVLKQIDAIYNFDSTYAAATIFQIYGGGNWKTFNVEPIIKPLTQYVASMGGGAPIVPITPVPPVIIPPTPQPSTGHFTVNWTSDNIQACYLNGVPIVGTGSQTFEIASDTEITFSVKAKQE